MCSCFGPIRGQSDQFPPLHCANGAPSPLGM